MSRTCRDCLAATGDVGCKVFCYRHDVDAVSRRRVSSECAAIILIVLAGGSNVLRDLALSIL